MTTAEKLRGLRERSGLSMEALAKRLGYSHASGVQRYENSREYGDKLLPLALVHNLAKVLAGLGQPPITDAEIYALAGVTALAGPYAKLGGQAPEADLGRILSDGLSRTADLPVYASAEGGDDGMTVHGDAIEWVSRPAPLANIRRAFAVYVLGDSMAPAYEQGDLILVNPSRPPRRGDDVLLAGNLENGDMAALVKRLLSWNADAWKVRQFNPQKDFSLSRTAWPKAYVIIGKYRGR